MGHPRWHAEPRMLESHFCLIKYALAAYTLSVAGLGIRTLAAPSGSSVTWHPAIIMLLRVGLFWHPTYEAYTVGTLLSLIRTEAAHRRQIRGGWAQGTFLAHSGVSGPDGTSPSGDMYDERYVVHL
ncbi:hypothetical protein KIPB_002817 [Kipferlia bialata]|uniref:Uncharacterized protein n=1 Tax=Kipferlia bialata TaxID=797122 RepID=A0A9K3CS01_9EUKA|nr:hypothetical protein KIPB_002817 [Kipferlia bialata]|eukprot:g2817.t1